MEYYGGIPRCARVIRLDGKHKNDPEIGKSVPLEVVETSSFNLAMNIVQDGKFVQSIDLKMVGFGYGKLATFVHRCLIQGSDVTGS